MKSYLNIVIQLLNIFMALIPNLVYPLIFGLEYHGEFLLIIALPTFAVFLVSLPYDNLLLKEMAARQNLGITECVHKLLWPKLALANGLYLAIVLWWTTDHFILQFVFLNSVGLSSFFVTALYAQDHKDKIVIFLIGFTAASLIFAVLVFQAGQPASVLVIALLGMNIFSALGALFLLRNRWKGAEKLDVHPVRILQMIGISSAMGMLSYGVVTIATGFLSPVRLSLLRISISIAQAATTFFPVNQRTIFEHIVSLSIRPDHKKMLEDYLEAAFWLVAFLALGITLALLLAFFMISSGLLPDPVATMISRYQREIIIIAPAVPLFLLASILEKAVLGLLREERGVMYGLVATFLVVSGSLVFMSFVPAGGFAAYTFASGAVVLSAVISLRRASEGLFLFVLAVLGFMGSGTILTYWATFGKEENLIALLATLLMTAVFIRHLWYHKRALLLNFIKG